FDQILSDLEALDGGRDVDWVVGLVTPFRGVARSVHQVGGAHLLSRHFVMRGMDDEQESLAFDKELPLVTAERRKRLYEERKAHKEIVVFLHEWGHTMGALHNEDPQVLMNPVYQPKAAGFSAFEKRLIALVLDRRLSRRGELHPELADLGPLLED